VLRDVVCPSFVGKEFHMVGALPLSQTDLGIVRRAQSVDLSGQEGRYQVNKSDLHFGARPFKALKVSSKIFFK